MVAERCELRFEYTDSCSLAKISMVAEPVFERNIPTVCCSLAKISMVAEQMQAKHLRN